jgi:rubrerythrin
MDEMDKLQRLIEHWLEHNAEHVRTYQNWAGVAETHGRRDLAALLYEIAEENRKLESLFQRAREAAQ